MRYCDERKDRVIEARGDLLEAFLFKKCHKGVPLLNDFQHLLK